ncbi:MAG: NYN domain-containing protein [Coriobacteriales bacterium]|jgi:hypothetical protein
MRYLIDGYNVTKRDPATCQLSLEAQREALEERMRTHARALIGTTDYLIVWDGAGGRGVVHGHDRKSAYTRLPTADDSIVERVRETSEKICVVTSDQGLRARCRSAARVRVEFKPSDALFADSRMFSALDEDAVALPSKKNAGKGKAHTKGNGTSRAKGSGTPSRRSQHVSPDVGIPEGANEINEELKKIWGIEDD